MWGAGNGLPPTGFSSRLLSLSVQNPDSEKCFHRPRTQDGAKFITDFPPTSNFGVNTHVTRMGSVRESEFYEF